MHFANAQHMLVTWRQNWALFVGRSRYDSKHASASGIGLQSVISGHRNKSVVPMAWNHGHPHLHDLETGQPVATTSSHLSQHFTTKKKISGRFWQESASFKPYSSYSLIVCPYRFFLYGKRATPSLLSRQLCLDA